MLLPAADVTPLRGPVPLKTSMEASGESGRIFLTIIVRNLASLTIIVSFSERTLGGAYSRRRIGRGWRDLTDSAIMS